MTDVLRHLTDAQALTLAVMFGALFGVCEARLGWGAVLVVMGAWVVANA